MGTQRRHHYCSRRTAVSSSNRQWWRLLQAHRSKWWKWQKSPSRMVMQYFGSRSPGLFASSFPSITASLLACYPYRSAEDSIVYLFGASVWVDGVLVDTHRLEMCLVGLMSPGISATARFETKKTSSTSHARSLTSVCLPFHPPRSCISSSLPAFSPTDNHGEGAAKARRHWTL